METVGEDVAVAAAVEDLPVVTLHGTATSRKMGIGPSAHGTISGITARAMEMFSGRRRAALGFLLFVFVELVELVSPRIEHTRILNAPSLTLQHSYTIRQPSSVLLEIAIDLSIASFYSQPERFGLA